MLKNKLRLIISICIAVLILLTFSFSFAVDDNAILNDVEIDENYDNIEEFDATNELDDVENYDVDTLNSDLYILNGNDIVIDYLVDGNAYIIAKSVTINSQINGDLFIIADTLNIKESGYVNNIFALSNSININGFVSTIYTCADNLTLDSNAYVYKDVYAMVNTFDSSGVIDRFSNVTKMDSFSTKTLFDYLSSLATYIVTVFAIYFIIAWLAPNLKQTLKELLTEKTLPVLGFGALGLVAIPVAMLILLLIGVGTKLSLALFAIYVFLLCITSSIFMIALSEVLIEKFKFEDKIKKLGMLSAVSIAFWLIRLIPLLGGLVSFASVLFGFGLIIKMVLPSKN